MAVHNSFKSAFRKVRKDVNAAKRQALTRAANSSRAKIAKDVSGEIGVSSATVKNRLKIFKGVDAAIISVGTKILLAAHAFKISKIKVQTSRGLRIGATYLHKAKGKQIAPAGVIVKGKSSGKNVVLTNTGDRVYKTVRVDGLLEAVNNIKGTIQTHLKETFQKNFKSSLDYFRNR